MKQLTNTALMATVKESESPSELEIELADRLQSAIEEIDVLLADREKFPSENDSRS